MRQLEAALDGDERPECLYRCQDVCRIDCKNRVWKPAGRAEDYSIGTDVARARERAACLLLDLTCAE